MKNIDELGNRIKLYESQFCGSKLIPLIPIVARLDGKSFSSFTRGLGRPYDERLSKLMIDTTKFLVEETNANCGYTQSDEITLVWYSDSLSSQLYFGGKIFKIISDLSSMCSVYFNKQLPNYIAEKSHLSPRFDCRVFNAPTLEEAVNAFYWREKDATKNSISMAASFFYSHKFLMGKSGKEKQELLFQKGINWNDYPNFFKRGTYVQRKKTISKMSKNEIENLPPNHNYRKNPDLEIERWVVDIVDMPPISKIFNKIDVIIHGKDPILIQN